MKTKIDFRRGDYSLKNRATEIVEKSKSESNDDMIFEIVKWQEDTCFTLCYWVQYKTDFDLRFVGSRPMEFIKDDDFLFLMKLGQTILDNLDLDNEVKIY